MIGTQAPCSPLRIPMTCEGLYGRGWASPGIQPKALADFHVVPVSQAPQSPHPQGTRLELYCLKTCYFSLISPGAMDGSEEA